MHDFSFDSKAPVAPSSGQARMLHQLLSSGNHVSYSGIFSVLSPFDDIEY